MSNKGKAVKRTRRKTTRKSQAKRPKVIVQPPRVIRGALLDQPKQDAEASTFSQIAHVKKRRYLEALATTPRISEACRLACVARRSAYLWAKDTSDVAFQEALGVASRLGLQRAIDEGWKRGVDGWEEPVYQGGRLVGTKLVKSDTMLIFMLKGEMPDKYREHYNIVGQQNITVQVGDVRARLAAALGSVRAIGAGAGVIDAD